MAVRFDSAPGRALTETRRPGGLADYLDRHITAGRPFAVVTGTDGPRVATAVGAALPARPGQRLVWLAGPLPTGRALLVALLAELGLAPPPAGLDELHHLLLVFLQHEARRRRHAVIVLTMADRCGPCVFDLLQTLARVSGWGPGSAAATFVLCGGQELHRIVESPGMAGMGPALRERFDTERGQPWLATTPLRMASPARAVAASGSAPGRLVLLLDGQVQARLSLLPGRTGIGRDATNAVCIPSRYVSRQHAVIVSGPDADRLIDLHSRNGTLVNGRPVRAQVLVDQDIIAVGNYRLRYRRPA